MTPLFETLAPLALNFARASEITSLWKNTLRRMAKSGRLRTITLGRRRVVPYDALKELVCSGTNESTAATADSR
jgi:excisionase family DNA binding protein